ncbi:hypothetical protein [Pengzhenrongella sp.]|jgi:hypothetical protein|uniref:hypothetical protein n=1 Tax=Pengzhenrongella sp. TaxID=2888820 RepID=UPI002F9430AB
MRTLSKKTSAVVASAALLGLVGSGVAYAYWTTSGLGAGTASTSAGAADLSVTQDATPVLTALYPGATSQTVHGTVTNNAANSASVATITGYVTVVKAVGAPGGTCDETDYVLGGSSTATALAPVAATSFAAGEIAAGGSKAFTYSLAFNNKALTNQDACKGAVVTINYNAS